MSSAEGLILFLSSSEDLDSILFAINRVPGVKDSRVQDKKVKRFHLNP